MARGKSKLYNISKEELQKLCDESWSLVSLGKKLNTQSYGTLKKIIEEYEIDTTKLNSNRVIRNDLTGRKFGRLTVIGINQIKRNGGSNYWDCKCDCGNESIVTISAHSLLDGKTKSCGCLRKENLSRIAKKYNEYDLSKEYGIGYTTNTNKPFYFDKEDFDTIKEYAWNESKFGYITTTSQNSICFLHRIIMLPPDNMEVDHINLNKADNRKDNLRICSRLDNSHNRKMLDSNTSGCTGVIWEKRFNKWRARIIINYKDVHLGLFEKFEDAVRARKEAEVKYFGEFRYKGD